MCGVKKKDVSVAVLMEDVDASRCLPVVYTCCIMMAYACCGVVFVLVTLCLRIVLVAAYIGQLFLQGRYALYGRSSGIESLLWASLSKMNRTSSFCGHVMVQYVHIVASIYYK